MMLTSPSRGSADYCMFKSPFRRVLRTHPLVSTADASKDAAPSKPPDQLGDIVQSLLLRFDDVLVKLDRIEAKVDLLFPATLVAPFTHATTVQT